MTVQLSQKALGLIAIGLSAFYLLMPSTFAAVLVDESAQDSLSGDKVESSSIFSGGHSSSSSARAKDVYEDLASFKRKKKMGISTTFAGATGLIGVNLDLNIFEDFAISLGGGVSHGFNSYNIHVKQTLGNDAFQPYFAFGYSRWFSNGGGPVDHTSPSLVVNKFLSEGAKHSGQFAENILYPAIGLQYVNLTGDYQGLGFFGELLMVMDMNNLAVGPTAGVGSIFYF